MSWELIVTASWEMEGPFKWGQSDSKSVSNSFYKAVSVIHFWQAYAYFMWFTLRETFQVLIKRQASPNRSPQNRRWRQTCPRETTYLWTKRLSRSICHRLSPCFSGSFSPCSSIWIPLGQRWKVRRWRRSHPAALSGAWVGLWSFFSHDRDTSNPVRI